MEKLHDTSGFQSNYWKKLVSRENKSIYLKQFHIFEKIKQNLERQTLKNFENNFEGNFKKNWTKYN